MAVSSDDYAAIADGIGRYCWFFDAGDGEAWVKLWTADGVLVGAAPEPLVGHDVLKMVPGMATAENPGTLRHLAGNLHCSYGETRDSVTARFYNLVTNWHDGSALQLMALCQATLVRAGDGWKIQRNELKMLGA